ncbi:unnamed protein product [Bursaphelenchus okinawaensis]|uniref:Piwi domain-containing protein n=1 Tax=Bursaphelenchus okinawaensis TaxID=465554 RepID=A0A811KCK4_9BILA|nr:unnamed protein product [Bursaphelenchus okinawaensis]CAG9101715.1 unnamed protein product [Bursaphelenchus okinawaensis]
MAHLPFGEDEKYEGIPPKVPQESNLRLETTKVRTNAFRMELPENLEGKTIYKYHIDIFTIRQNRERQADGTFVDTNKAYANIDGGMKGAINKTHRDMISFAVLNEVATQNSVENFSVKEMIYDRSHILFYPKLLSTKDEEIKVEILLEKSDTLKALDYSFLGKVIGFKVTFKKNEEFKLSLIDKVPTVTQFLDVMTNMYLYRNQMKGELKDVVYQDSTFFFVNNSKPIMNDIRILVRGIKKSVKLVTSNNKQGYQYVCQVQVKSSPFFPKVSVFTFLHALLKKKLDGGNGRPGFNGGNRGNYNNNRGNYGGQRDNRYGNDRGGDRYSNDRGDRYGNDRGDRYGNDRGDRYDRDRSNHRNDRYSDRGSDRRGSDRGNDRQRERSPRRNDENVDSSFVADNIGNHLDWAIKHLKNVVVKTTHQPKPRIFPIFKLSDKSFNEMSFMKGEKEINVYEHFLSMNYGVTVNPHLPCVVQKDTRTKRDCYYPMECLEIVNGQKISMQKSQMEPSLTEAMTRQCQMLPPEQVEVISGCTDKNQFCLANINIYAKQYGITIDKEIATTEAYKLDPPVMQFRGTTSQVSMDSLNWKMNNLNFEEPRNGGVKWAIVNLNNALRPEELTNFESTLCERARSLGMDIDRPETTRLNDSEITKYVQEKKQEDFEYIIFLSRQRDETVHNTIKMAELRWRVLSQHCLRKNAVNIKQDFCINFLMKANLKLGGLNQHPVLSNRILGSLSRYVDLSTTMYMGLAYSGSGPLSLYERQAGLANDQPQSVALCYTMNDKLKMHGRYWFYKKPSANDVKLGEKQELKFDTVGDERRMREQFLRALDTYQKINGQYPKHIFFYRTGSSHGDYWSILSHEVEQLKEVLHKINPAITFTFIVAADQSGFKMYKLANQIRDSDKAYLKNLSGGTMMSVEFMHPRFTQFVLQSHKVIQGTGRVVRYTVLADTLKRHISAELLGCVTNMLAYGHGIVNSPVSMPAQLYSATSLAERAQNLVKRADRGLYNDMDELTRSLDPHLANRYWA